MKHEWIEGVLKKRSSKYTVLVDIYGEEYSCYYPGGKEKLKDIPCLLSVRKDLKRRTPYCVEAILQENQWKIVNETTVKEFLLNTLQANSKASIGPHKMDFQKEDTYYEIVKSISQDVLVSHIKDLMAYKQKIVFIDIFGYLPESFYERYQYYVEEAIDQGFEFQKWIIHVDKDGMEVIEKKSVTEEYL